MEHLRPAVVCAVLTLQLAFYSGFHFLVNFGPSFFQVNVIPSSARATVNFRIHSAETAAEVERSDEIHEIH